MHTRILKLKTKTFGTYAPQQKEIRFYIFLFLNCNYTIWKYKIDLLLCVQWSGLFAFLPLNNKRRVTSQKGIWNPEKIFFVYFTIENRIMMSSIALPIRMFLALATEKSTILEELEERVWGYTEFPMLSNHRIPSNVGVFIAFGIGGHGIAGNGHSHLNQIVSWNVHKHQLKSREKREPFF